MKWSKQNQSVWNKHYRRDQSKLSIPDENVVRYIRKSNIPEGAVILDLGTGSGRHLDFLNENHKNIYGFDFAREAIVGRPNVIQGDASMLPFQDSCFDFILIWGVLHYLDHNSSAIALEEVRRILKPGAKLFTTLRSDLDTYLEMTLNQGDLDKGCARLFSKEEVSQFFSRFSKITTGFISRTPLGEEALIAHHMIEAIK